MKFISRNIEIFIRIWIGRNIVENIIIPVPIPIEIFENIFKNLYFVAPTILRIIGIKNTNDKINISSKLNKLKFTNNANINNVVITVG